MIKNGIIALLIAGLVMTVEEYAMATGPVMFVSMVIVLFYAVSAVEYAIDRYKDWRYQQRKLVQEINRAQRGVISK